MNCKNKEKIKLSLMTFIIQCQVPHLITQVGVDAVKGVERWNMRIMIMKIHLNKRKIMMMSSSLMKNKMFRYQKMLYQVSQAERGTQIWGQNNKARLKTLVVQLQLQKKAILNSVHLGWKMMKKMRLKLKEELKSKESNKDLSLRQERLEENKCKPK